MAPSAACWSDTSFVASGTMMDTFGTTPVQEPIIQPLSPMKFAREEWSTKLTAIPGVSPLHGSQLFSRLLTPSAPLPSYTPKSGVAVLLDMATGLLDFLLRSSSVSQIRKREIIADPT